MGRTWAVYVSEHNSKETVWALEKHNWKKLFDVELHNLFYSPDSIWMIKEDMIGGTHTILGRGVV
jgi:hypothetical protein